MRARRSWALVGAALSLACAAPGTPSEEPSVNDRPPYEVLEDTSTLAQRAGDRVALTGKISDLPWQHLIDDVPSHPHADYFDVGRDQIVIYSREPIGETRAIRVEGTVRRVEGRSKGPSERRHTEHHLVVDGWTLAE